MGSVVRGSSRNRRAWGMKRRGRRRRSPLRPRGRPTAPSRAGGYGRARGRCGRPRPSAPRAWGPALRPRRAVAASRRNGVDRELVVGRQGRPAGGQDLETQMGGGPARRPATPRRSGRRAASTAAPRRILVEVALGGDERVEGVEQDADGGCEPQAFRARRRPVEQGRARRLQLLRERRLLADRRRRRPARSRRFQGRTPRRPRAGRGRARGSSRWRPADERSCR